MAKSKKTTTDSPKPPVWNKSDDKKLKALFLKQVRKGGIDPQDLDSKTIHQVIANHWPDRKYKTFAPLYKRKARQYNIGQSKSGARKKATCKLFCFIISFYLINPLLT